MKKQGRRRVSAILVIIMIVSTLMQNNLAANADEQQQTDISINERVIGLDQGLPVYCETLETGTEPTLPERVRVIIALPEKEGPAEEVIEEDTFIPAEPPEEAGQWGYELISETNGLYRYCYDEETDVTQEIEAGCAYQENGIYAAYRIYGSLNGARVICWV